MFLAYKMLHISNNQDQALGLSTGGFTTRFMLGDALENLLKTNDHTGQAFDIHRTEFLPHFR